MIDASEAPVSPAPDASSSDPGLARLSGLFFSPVATLESIARRPTWVAPLLLWTALSVAVTAVLLPKIDYEQLTRQAMQSRGQSIPEDRMASIVQQLWSLGFFVIGFAAAARVKRGAAAGVIVTLWLLTVAIRAGWNAIF